MDTGLRKRGSSDRNKLMTTEQLKAAMSEIAATQARMAQLQKQLAGSQLELTDADIVIGQTYIVLTGRNRGTQKPATVVDRGRFEIADHIVYQLQKPGPKRGTGPAYLYRTASELRPLEPETVIDPEEDDSDDD